MHPPVHSDIGKANAKLSIAAGSSECHHFSKYIVRHESDFMREKYCATETNCGAEEARRKTEINNKLYRLCFFTMWEMFGRKEKNL